MTIIARYLALQIVKVFALVLLAVTGIYLAVDFFERIDDFIATGQTTATAVLYFIYKIPFVASQMLPVGMLLAVLISLGLMSRHNELLALQSGGVGLTVLLRPVVVLGVLAGAALFALANLVVPAAMARANAIWLQQVRQERAEVVRHKNIWVRVPEAIMHVRYVDRTAGSANGVSIFRLSPEFGLTGRIEARAAIYADHGRWHLRDAVEQRLDAPADEGPQTRVHPHLTIDLPLALDDLVRVVKTAEEMSFAELWRYIRRVEAQGYNATAYRVDLHAKLAFPAVCVLLGMIATGLAVRRSLREGLALCIAYGMGIAFLYWIFYSFCLSLGYGAMLPPALAAWIPNGVFFCVGVLSLIGADGAG